MKAGSSSSSTRWRSNSPRSCQSLLLSARTKPFAESQDTIVDVALKQFDLAPWMAYLPIEPRFKLPSALLTTNLELSFSQPTDAPPVVSLRGPLQIDQLVVQDRDGAPVATAQKSSAETLLHTQLYRRYPEIGCVNNQLIALS